MSVEISNTNEADIIKEMEHPSQDNDRKESLIALRDLRVQTQLKLNEYVGKASPTPEEVKLIDTMKANMKTIDESITSIEGKAATMLFESAKSALAGLMPSTTESVSVINIKEEKKMTDEKVKEAHNEVGMPDSKFVSPTAQNIPQASAPAATAGDSDKPKGMSAESTPPVPAKEEEEEKVKPKKEEAKACAKCGKSPCACEEMAKPKGKLVENPATEEKKPGLTGGGVKPSPPVAPPKSEEEGAPATSNVPNITTSDKSKREEGAPETSNVPSVTPAATSSGKSPEPASKDVPVTFPSGSVQHSAEPAKATEEEEEKAKPKAKEEEAKPKKEEETVDSETGVKVAKEEYDPTLSVTGRQQAPFSSIRRAHEGRALIAPESMIPKIGARSVIKVPGRYMESLQPADIPESYAIHESIAGRAREVLEKMGGDKTTAKALSFKAMKEILDRYMGQIQT